MNENDRVYRAVENAEAFAEEVGQDREAWIRWARRQPGQVRKLFFRIRQNSDEHFDKSVHRWDELSPGLQTMLTAGISVWKAEGMTPD